MFLFRHYFSGMGFGISGPANALALNTYWKKRRRVATGLSWTITGLGPILWPHLITWLSIMYGDTGTVLILSGFALHAVAGALLLHPVEWHSKSLIEENIEEQKNLKSDVFEKKDKESGYFGSLTKLKNLSVFSSQYLYNEDDPVNTGYEITDPGVPMMLKSNDGYFSQSRQSRSRLSSREGSTRTSRLTSKKPSMTNLLENRSRKSSTLYLNESKKSSSANLASLTQERDNYSKKRKPSLTLTAFIPESEIEDCPTLKAPQDLKAAEKAAVENIDPEKAKSIAVKEQQHLTRNISTNTLKIDSQYGDKYNKDNHSNVSFKNNTEYDENQYLKNNHSNQSYRTKLRRKSNNFNHENEVLKQASLKLEQYLKENVDNDASEKLKLLINNNLNDEVFEGDKEEEEKLTLCQKISMFFDLDLLKDFTFINLMLGITLANFTEVNFSILTPFIFGDLGLDKTYVALFMSLLAGIDVCVRFSVPFIAAKTGWDNNSFFLLGIISMGLGRISKLHIFFCILRNIQ